MAIKIEKYVYRKTADIFLRRINCTEENILKVLDLFAFQNVMLEISDVKKDDTVFEEIKRRKLKHTTTLEDISSPYFDIVLLTNLEQLKELVGYILESDSEAFCITNLGNEFQWEQYLYNKVAIRKLIKCGKVDINICITPQQSAMGIVLSNAVYDGKKMAVRLKQLFSFKSPGARE